MHSNTGNIRNISSLSRGSIPASVLEKYSIEKYDATQQKKWDDFVEKKSINGTLLHTRKFFNHNPLNSTDDRSYLFYKKNILIGVIACALEGQNDTMILNSHPRATYGGFIVSKQVGVEAALAIVSKLLQEAKCIGVKEIIIKNPFRIFFKKPCDEFDYALWYHGFNVKYRELEIAIPIGDTGDFEKNYTEGTRSGLHKAKKILTVEQSVDYKPFWSLLIKTLKERHGTTPTHNYSQFCELLRNVGQEKIKLFVAKKNGKMIAGMVLFILNEICVHAQYIAYDSSFQNDRPMNILIHEISLWAKENGYRYFNLGRANEQNGDIVNYNLFKFKESYGGRGVLRET